MFNRFKRTAGGRRKFLGLAAAAGGAAATLGFVKGALARPERQQLAPAAPQAGKGYRETAHIREYYNKARF